MKTQKWLLIASVVILLGAAALVAFTVVTPYVLAQGPMGWYGRGDGSGPMFGRGTGQDFGMGGGRGMMNDGAFGPGFGMGPGGGPGRMGPGGRWDGPENSLVAVAAEKLGLTNAELIAELQAGKSIADVAQEKNVDVDTIVEAVITPRSDRLKELVTNGQLTQEQADTMLAQMKTNLTERINEKGLPQGYGRGMGYADEDGDGLCDCAGMGGARGGRWGGPGNSLAVVAAEKLGLTPAELFTELQVGKSIADVAKDKDVALNTIVDAVLAPRTDRLNQLVTNGQLTQEEVNNRLANLRVDVIDWLNQSWGSQNSAPGAAPDSSGSY